MNEPSWRDLLARLISVPTERQRVAEALSVNPQTLVRWTTGESQPRLQNIKNLPNVFPPYRQQFIELIQRELSIDLLPPAASTPPRSMAPFSPPEIPSEYLVRILGSYATTDGPFSSWSLRAMSLQQLMAVLDAERGMEISLVRCVPPDPAQSKQEQSIKSLCEIMSIGSPPWASEVERKLLFLGSESLAGWVVGHGEPGVIQNMDQPGLIPFRRGPHEKSAAAYPLLRRGTLAGCLLASCCEYDAWTPSALYYLEAYSYVLALSFYDEEFYDPNAIALRDMPFLTPEQEHAFLVSFPQQVRAFRQKHAFHPTIVQAETVVLSQLESEWLQEKETDGCNH